MQEHFNLLQPDNNRTINCIWLWTVRVILVVDVASQAEQAMVCSSPSLELSPTACYSFLLFPFIVGLLLLTIESTLKWGLLFAAGLAFLILFLGGIVGYGFGSWIAPLQVVLVIAAFKAQRTLPQGQKGAH